MSPEVTSRVEEKISEMLEKVIQKRCKDEPFDVGDVYDSNPFGVRLVPMEVWKGSKFERSFVTVLGQGIFEQIAKIIAEGTGAKAENQYTTVMQICTYRIEKVNEILNDERNQKKSLRKPDWNKEVKEILALNNKQFGEVTVKSDLYIERTNGDKEFYSFKTVKPNLDQTEKAKRDMLLLLSGDSSNKVYFAFPYNPAGEGNSYREAKHNIPYKLFDIDNDPCVLIGSALWDHIGNKKGTYIELLDIFEKVGSKFRPIIRRDYFGL